MAEVSRSRTLAPGARQPWYRRPRLQFTAQAVLLLAIVLGMVSQVVSSRREAEELLHVNGVAADLVRLSGDLWDVETGARRYVLTGRDAWLAPYHAAVRDIDERTGHLRTLTQDDPVTAGALAHFTAAKDRELQRIARLVEVRRRQGADAALAAVRTGVGNEEMDALLRDLDGILAHWRDRRAVLAIGLADGQARLAGIVAFGAALGIVLLVWSYRTQQRATNALRQSSNEKQAILDGLVEGVSKQAADGRVVTANARAPEILGLTEDQLLGRDSHDPRWGCVREDGTPYPGDEHPPMIALRTGRPVFDVTLGIDKPDGSRRWLRVNSVPLFEDGAAAPVAVVSSFLDITDERAAGQALRDSQSRLQTILDSVPAPITYWDAHRICLFANQAAMDWYAPAGGQVVGRETAEVIGDRADAASETFRLRALAGERCDFERIDHDAAGEARNVVVNYIPHVADGEVRGLFALVTDTTELSRAVAARTKELAQANEALRKSLRAKDEFLANASHEMRTPLHAIRSFLGLARKRLGDAPDEKIARFLGNVDESAARLSVFVEDVLLLTRLEGVDPGFAPSRLRLPDIVEAVRQRHGAQLAERDQRIEVIVAARDPVIEADAALADQVVSRLLANAIRFSPAGGAITLTVRDAVPGNPAAGVCLSIGDEGVGIPADELELIFGKFEQSSRTKSGAGGKGLGLPICRAIMTLHHGAITARNGASGGAIFEAVFPRTQSGPVTPAAAA
jgi:PAS domain S-box-containing protein